MRRCFARSKISRTIWQMSKLSTINEPIYPRQERVKSTESGQATKRNVAQPSNGKIRRIKQGEKEGSQSPIKFRKKKRIGNDGPINFSFPRYAERSIDVYPGDQGDSRRGREIRRDKGGTHACLGAPVQRQETCALVDTVTITGGAQPFYFIH